LKRLKPRSNWGGEGCLGLDVGQGYLHTLPSESRKTNGVACSLMTPATQNRPPNTVVDPIATSSRSEIPSVREAKISRRTNVPSSDSSPVKVQSSVENDDDTNTHERLPATTNEDLAKKSAEKSPTPAEEATKPSRLPLSATLSPRESKRNAGSKTPR